MSGVEVIELSEDGAFEIPSPERKATRIAIQIEDDDEEPNSAQLQAAKDNILLDLSDDTYKVFRSPVDVVILVKAVEGEVPQKCFIHERKIKVITNLSRYITIPFPEYVKDDGKITCTYFENFISLKLE